jgi:phenylacetate-CoA ligase
MSTKPWILKNVILPLADMSMGTELVKTYHQIKDMNTWTRSDIEQWQNAQLRKLITHVYRNVAYYRSLMEELKLTPDDFRTKDDLEKLPVTTKAIIKKNYPNFIPKNLKKIPHMNSSTGGSTGEPLKFKSDLRLWSFINAHKIFSWEKVGYQYGDKVLTLGSTSLFSNDKPTLKRKIYNQLRGYYPRNGVNLSDAVCQEYVDLIRKNNIWYLYGYASSLFLLASYCEKYNIQLSMGACFPTSEILTDTYREILSRVFNCKVMDSYGARDGGITSFEISRNRHHIGYNSIIEIYDQFSPTGGKLLATDLYNYSFPFIRYEIGDEVEMLDNQQLSDSDYNGQIITEILGRITEIIKLENGNVLTGPGFTILFRNLNVLGYRIQKIGEMHIVCEIIKGEDYSVHEEKLIQDTIIRHAGDNCIVDLVYKEKFELAPSGKRNYFISN